MSNLERAWVMVVRKRTKNARFQEAERSLRELRSGDCPSIKDVFTVLGHYDIALVVEDKSLVGIHRTISKIHDRLREKIRSTHTYISVHIPNVNDPGRERAGYSDRPIDVHPLMIGITCRPGEQPGVAASISQLPGAKIVDFVFGDLDIIALFLLPEEELPLNKRRTFNNLLMKLTGIDGIEKTTTMQIVPFDVDDHPSQRGRD